MFPPWEPASAQRMIETGEFRFLNVTHPRSAQIPWSAPGFSRLWLYHLNYCDFLNVDLTRPSDAGLLRNALRAALDWCEQNASGSEIGWEPYPLSLRAVNWLKFLLRHADRLEELGEADGVSRIVNSLRLQVLSLERRMEKDLLANHLLKNAKALMFAGALLEAPESARWWATGAKLLMRELAEQILPDGGHFERSPMYHAQALEDLMDLEDLAWACGRTLPGAPTVSERVAQMAAFLRGVLHPDGEIPLFNDSAFGVARSPAELLSLAGASAANNPEGVPEVNLFPETGYGVIRAPGSQSCLIFDCGPLGPDYQPGHGHCDLLSYELSLHGQRVVVDTGASTYQPGPERHYERSTAAHNTVRIDGEEQAEIWASFRVGRRPRAGCIKRGEVGGFRFVRGEHFGYRGRGVVHARTIIHLPENSWVVVDFLQGKGRHRMESFVHFHPAVRVEPFAGDGRPGNDTMHPRFAIEFANRCYWLMTLGAGQFTLRESWYSPEFGLRQSRPVVRWIWEQELPATQLYAFVPAGARPPAIRYHRGERAVAINGIRIP